MAKADTADGTKARAPRGAKLVSRAFFIALEQVPETSRAPVARAALAMIRDEMKVQREKAKAAAAKEKARKPAPAKGVAKTTAAKPAARRSRKTDVPAAA